MSDPGPQGGSPGLSRTRPSGGRSLGGAGQVIKICGLTRPDDAAFAAGAGADWLGLNFWPRSRRFVERSQAAELAAAARAARADLALVGVFVDQPVSEVREVMDEIGLDYAQLHGDETPAHAAALAPRAIKAIPVAAQADVDRLDDYAAAAFLLDTPSPGRGGSGAVGDWSLARLAAGRHRVLLAGGLTPDNVARAIAEVAPFGVDVASGVETVPGHKDRGLVERFVRAARAAFASASDGGER